MRPTVKTTWSSVPFDLVREREGTGDTETVVGLLVRVSCDDWMAAILGKD